jgi:hypothetical protein
MHEGLFAARGYVLHPNLRCVDEHERMFEVEWEIRCFFVLGTEAIVDLVACEIEVGMSACCGFGCMRN